MPKRSSKRKDINILAVEIVEEATKEDQFSAGSKNPHAVALGRLGGLKGGLARAQKLTPEQRKEIARNAAKIRWAKKSH
ncbi:MAG: hypothetical protein M1371_11085 [Actinobacteria bacterium]|nr:hypothetical protein [Actinomycetota bacterium]